MLQKLNLNWLRTFEAAARHLSFTAASRELGLTQTAVSQHIKALELKLGQQLFIRRAKSLELTDIGEAYLPSVREAIDTVGLSTTGLFGPELASTVVVRASIACIVWLSSRLERLQDDHPGITIKFVTSIWPERSGRQIADIDLTLAPRKHAGHHLEKLSDERIVPICGLSQASAISGAGDLLKFPAIHILGFDDHWARYLAAFGHAQDADRARVIVDTSVAACELVAAERGCAVLIERFAEESVRAGRPVRIAGEPVPLAQSHYMSLATTARDKPAADIVANWFTPLFRFGKR